MRWRYLIPRVLLLIGLIAYARFGLDPSIRYAGTAAAAAASGRAVELDSVRTTFWPPTFEATTLNVADENASAAEVHVGRVRVAMNPDAVKHRLAVADEVIVDGVRWDVPAEFEITQVDESEAETPEWLADLTARGAEALDSQLAAIEGRIREKLDPERLETMRLARQKETDYRTTFQYLQAEYEYLRLRTKQLKELAEDSDTRRALLMQPERLEAAVRESAAAKERLAELKKELAALKTKLH